MERVRLPRTATQWLGQTVYRLTGSLPEMQEALPQFSRQRLTHENTLNEYLDLVLREPDQDDDRRVPVSTVSRKYSLIQHRNAVSWLVTAFKKQGWDTDKVKATAWLSEYGERLRIDLVLPDAPVVILREDDALRAEVCLWNSVDRSRSFEIAIRWLRLVCLNGLAVWDEDRLRKIHYAEWMKRESPIKFLTERLPQSIEKTASLKEWVSVALTAERLTDWVDGSVTARWGRTRAARVLHIIQTGHDCAVGRATENVRASQLELQQGREVPGAPQQSKNAYDVYQALLWIAGSEKSVDQREAMATSSLLLVNDLLPESLRTKAA